MIVVMRFRVPEAAIGSFEPLFEQACALFSGSAGCENAESGRNLDDPELWVLVSRWADVRSYRRALGGYEAKLVLSPLAVWSLDEPTAFGPPETVGENVPRSR